MLAFLQRDGLENETLIVQLILEKYINEILLYSAL